jgi:hypothetical protein
MNASERPRATYTHIHRKVHGALFVQTINDVAQGHHAQFARISIVVIIIIIMIERLFEKREREKKGMFIMYMFVLRLCAIERKNAHAFVYGHKAQK